MESRDTENSHPLDECPVWSSDSVRLSVMSFSRERSISVGIIITFRIHRRRSGSTDCELQILFSIIVSLILPLLLPF